MLNFLLILLGKLLSKAFQLFNLGSGSTWPGHIALKVNHRFVRDISNNSRLKIVLIAGTNGKTTTTKLIETALEENGKKVLDNESGANMLSGLASTLLLHSNMFGKLDYDYAIFEVDEYALPIVVKELHPAYLVLLNLFRDQLDRYGEINNIVNTWKKVLSELPKETTVVLNADDPQIAYLGNSATGEVSYFGLQPSQLQQTKLQHAADSVYCPKCGAKLIFDGLAFSHIGNWKCSKCHLKRPEIATEGFAIYPLSGLYNKYNVQAATTVLKHAGLTQEQINNAFTGFIPAFGRQEIVEYQNKKIQLFLSKNPTSFNQSYATIREIGGKTLLLVLNNRMPDGRDVSWIWDIDLPNLSDFKHILVAGDRVYDIALRMKYELGIKQYESIVKTFENLEEAINKGVKLVEENETFFVLPTYSAMLEVRKIITGKKIL